MKIMFSFLVVGMLAAPAWAESKAQEIARDFAKGEFEQVIKKADGALRRASDSTEVAQLQVLRAQALLALGQPDKARAAFGIAVQKDPTVELDAQHASPDAVRLLEKVRADLPATLVVLVKAGRDADVAVDDKELGPAPLQTQVQGGVHVVLAKGGDGRTTRVEAQVPPGRKVVLELELELRKPGAGPTKVAPPAKAQKAPEKKAEGQDAAAAEASRSVVLQPVEPVVMQMIAPRPATLALWVGGGAVALGGVLSLAGAGVQYNKLNTTGVYAPGQGETAVATGQTLQAVGWVGVGVGVGLAAVGGLMWWLDSKTASSPQVGLMVTPSGAWVGVHGALP